MITVILNLLRTDGYITVHKQLIKSLGLVAATLFAELCGKYKYFFDAGKLKDGYFYYTFPDCEEELGLSRREQEGGLEKLIQCKLIEKKVMKLKGDDAPRRYIKITNNLNELLRLLGMPPEGDSTGFVQNEQIELTKTDKSNCSKCTPNKNKDIRLKQEELKRNLYTQVSNNTHTDFNGGNITPVHSAQSKEEEQTPVCEQTVSLEQLQQEIKATIGETLVLERLKKLVHTCSIERIRYHLEHWHIHRLNQTKKGAGYFITVVENDIPPVAPEKKSYATTDRKPQRDNFDQREYTDEELEKFYANLQSL